MERVKDYKITIIPPFEDDSDYYCEGRIDSDSKHGDIMREYGMLVYGNNSVFNIMGENCIPTTAEHYLELYGNVVFYNLSDDFGILCVMDYVDRKQRKALNRLFNELEGYTVEFDYFMTCFDTVELDDPFEDSGNFNIIKSCLDGITVEEKVKKIKGC